MKRTSLILISIMIMALTALVVSSCGTSAKIDSSPSPSVPQTTHQEESLQEDILTELDQAKQYTDDEEILDHLDAIINRVRDLGEAEVAGSTEDVPEAIRNVAKLIEILINDLPLASSTATPAAASASSPTNPLYEELLSVRAKVEKLIIFETSSKEISPTPPRTLRPPDMGSLSFYLTKFLCGPAFEGGGVQRGSYSTSVSIYNPHNQTVTIYEKAVVADHGGDPRDEPSPFRIVKLGPDNTINIDCLDIFNLLNPQETTARIIAPTMEEVETGLSQPSQGEESEFTDSTLNISEIRPLSVPVEFVEGFVVIYSTAPLEVVAVYTASTPLGLDVDIERYSTNTAITQTVPPSEESECPQDCLCLTEAEARKEGYVWCDGQVKKCGQDPTNGATKYCFEKYECPEGCVCLTAADAEELGYPLCDGQKILCESNVDDVTRYCYEKTVEEDCPQGCSCLTELDARDKGYDLCGGKRAPCGYEPGATQKWCYEQGRASKITIEPTQDANRIGTNHVVTITVYDEYGNPMANTGVTVQITGANSYAPSVVTTDDSGKAYFGYSGENLGSDTIVATVDSLSATASAEWHHRYTGYNSGRLPDELRQ